MRISSEKFNKFSFYLLGSFPIALLTIKNLFAGIAVIPILLQCFFILILIINIIHSTSLASKLINLPNSIKFIALLLLWLALHYFIFEINSERRNIITICFLIAKFVLPIISINKNNINNCLKSYLKGFIWATFFCAPLIFKVTASVLLDRSDLVDSLDLEINSPLGLHPNGIAFYYS